MANLKNITELPVAESVEGLNFIVNDNGSAKQIAASTACMQSDWNQNDSAANDYIKNRPFYDGRQWKVVIEETEVLQNMPSPGGVFYGLINGTIPSFFDQYPKGTVVKCVFDGKEYISTIRDCWMDRVIGNYDKVSNNGFGDTGENFAIQQNTENGNFLVSCWDYAEGETFTVSVSVLEVGELHKMDEKFLPDRVANRKPYIIDSESYTYGDDALAAILESRQILIKVPNKGNSTLYSNFMPVLQYQLPNENNNYLTLFYLNDGIAENIMTAMQTGSFAGVYGSIEMMLSKTYTECPLKVDPVK